MPPECECRSHLCILHLYILATQSRERVEEPVAARTEFAAILRDGRSLTRAAPQDDVYVWCDFVRAIHRLSAMVQARFSVLPSKLHTCVPLRFADLPLTLPS